MIHLMVISKIASELVRFGIKHRQGLLRAEYSVYRKAGWKPFAARGISHGTAAGGLLGTLIRDNDTLVGIETPFKKRTASYKQDKTRSRYKRNSYCRNTVGSGYHKCRRRTRSRF